jgi:hypothetical protein
MHGQVAVGLLTYKGLGDTIVYNHFVTNYNKQQLPNLDEKVSVPTNKVYSRFLSWRETLHRTLWQLLNNKPPVSKMQHSLCLT